MAYLCHVLVLLLATLPLLFSLSEAQPAPPLAKGLSWAFYKKSCPKVGTVVRDYLKAAIQKGIGLAAGLLRIHFHDCFVQGLFTSDQDLYTDPKTRGIVTAFAVDQELFFERFAYSMVKMGQLSVLTGNQGEIRASCSSRNPARRDESLQTVVDGDGRSSAF